MGKRGPQPSGDARKPLTLNVRAQLRRDIEAAAAASGTTVSAWLRWAVKAVLARGWSPPPGSN
jgi:hypothetical protein